jgi:hypothetical protein
MLRGNVPDLPYVHGQVVQLRFRQSAGFNASRGADGGTVVRRDEHPISLPENCLRLSALSYEFGSAAIGSAEECAVHVERVGASIGLKGDPHEGSEGGEQVYVADDGRRLPRSDAAGPAENERDPSPAIEHAVLAAPQRPGWAVIATQSDRAIVIAVIENGSVVAREYDDRILAHADIAQRPHHLANAPVHLGNDVATRPKPGGSREAPPREARDVWLMEGVIQEERFILVLSYE